MSSPDLVIGLQVFYRRRSSTQDLRSFFPDTELDVDPEVGVSLGVTQPWVYGSTANFQHGVPAM